MGDGTKENPFTREDVLRLIEEHGGKAEALDLSGKYFEEGIDLSGLSHPSPSLSGIILNDTRLVHANFNGSDLDGAVMQRANLQNATFNPLKLSDPPETKAAILSKADMRGAYLKNAEFREADLSGAQFQEDPEESLRANLEETDFRNANLFGTNFKECYFYRTKLEGACIEGSNIHEARLGDADWGNYIIGEEKNNKFDVAEHRYRQLKAWHTQSGYGDKAAKFYYREKEANRKALKWCSRNWHHRGASEFIRALFGYGERWWNVVFSIETLILLFAFTYLAIAASWEWWLILLVAWIPGLIVWGVYLKFATGLDLIWWKKAPVWVTGMGLLFLAFYFLSGLVPSQYVFWRYLYFSTVSFTALGYGEWVKLDYSSAYDAIRRIGAFESLVGISMMALLLVTFFRKWTR